MEQELILICKNIFYHCTNMSATDEIFLRKLFHPVPATDTYCTITFSKK